MNQGVKTQKPANFYKDLWKLRINLVQTPMMLTLGYFGVRLTTDFTWESGFGVMIGFWIGAISNIFFALRKPKLIYDCTNINETLILQLTNVFGKTENMIVPYKQIEYVKFQKKNFFLLGKKTWIHTTDDVKELNLLNYNVKEDLFEILNRNKIEIC